MQPRILLGSTFALVMAVSGAAFAGGGAHDPKDSDTHYVPPQTKQTATVDGRAAHVTITREQTMEMQRALTARNLYQGKSDGVWGPKTESALKNFQTQNSLEATGELNEPTAKALGLDMSRQYVAGTDDRPVTTTDPPVAGTAAPATQHALEDGKANIQLQSLTQAQAREMQQRLQLLGYYRGEVDGKVGEGTRAALQRYFQRQAELAQQGVISNSAISMFGTNVTEVPAK